jgi:hypothetical protein
MSTELRSLICVNCGASDFESKSETEWECRYCGTDYTMAEGLCPFCGFLNSPQADFCGRCGEDLAWVCPACHVENRVTASRTMQAREAREALLAADLEAVEADRQASEERLQRMWAQEEARQAALREAQARQREIERKALYIVAAAFAFVVLLICVAGFIAWLSGG